MTVVRVTRLAPRDPVARPGGGPQFLGVRGLASSLGFGV